MSIANEFEGGVDEYMLRLQEEADQVALDEAIWAEEAERCLAAEEEDTPADNPDWDIYHANLDYIGGEW